jgi:hypothetical protein
LLIKSFKSGGLTTRREKESKLFMAEWYLLIWNTL